MVVTGPRLDPAALPDAPGVDKRAYVPDLHLRPWGWLFEGCDPHRHTTGAVERAGFSTVRHERPKLRHSLSWPVNTAAWGIATR